MIQRLLTATIAALSFICISASGETLSPTKLRCEHLDNPSVIDIVQPRLSWVNEAKENGQFQTAYEIQVASSREALEKGRADLWSSGRVRSSESVFVPYGRGGKAAKELKSGDDCWWRVRVWDKDGKRSKWSKTAYWGMGILRQEEWQAQWIAGGELLRKDFALDKKIKQAKIFLTGLGFFELYANGVKVGDDVLTPNETSYTHRPGLDKLLIPVDGDAFRGYRVNYLRYDLTEALRQGENAVEILLGNGMYNADNARWMVSYGTPKAICRLEIIFADGSRKIIVTDGSWMASRSRITHNNLFTGETYDAGLEPEWKAAQIVAAPDGKLCAQMSPSDKVCGIKRPVSVKKLGEETWEVVFDEYITGWVRLKNISAPRGKKLNFKYKWEENLRDWDTPYNGVSNYICSGNAPEEYAPKFCWFTFSTVVIEGLGVLDEDDISAEVVHSDVRQTGSFECSNPLLNRINQIYVRTQTNNMHLGVATDCPHREKGPYTGDGQVSCTSAMHNFDLLAFYNKWLKDMSDVQDVNTGYVPNGAPWHQGCGGGVAWGAAMNIIPWETYIIYGDMKILEDNYFQMTEQLRFMNSWETPDGTMNMQMPRIGEKPLYWMNLGEWCPAFGLVRDELVHTFYYWLCTDYTARAAKVLGKSDDANKYRAKADAIAAAFHGKYYDGSTYGNDGGNIFALVMGVPQDRLNNVRKSLKKELMTRAKHLVTGIFGTRYFFEVLSENGMGDIAYEAMCKTDYPSYGFWLAQGATTMWEYWSNYASHNHPMFGGGLNWLYRNLAGVRVDENEPGYRHIIIAPEIYDGLDRCRYSTESLYGRVGAEWRREGSRISMKVQVPVGCRATVHVPGGGVVELASGEYSL